VTNPQDKDRLIDHSYDDIQEYDNPMPAWWVFTFWVTIVFSVFYYINPWNTGVGKGVHAEYAEDMAAFRAEFPQGTGGISAAQLLSVARRPADVAQGKAVYTAKCAACHAADGGGSIGPNLTDNAWLHGASIDSIYTTVDKGVLAKGMPAWGALLKADELSHVVAYVWSIRGSTPAKPKPPQGVVSSQ
jgi:cytochrome c oxidase cbb3-type subunit III